MSQITKAQIAYALQFLNGSSKLERRSDFVEQLSVREVSWTDLIVGATTVPLSETHVVFGGLTAPKLLIVLGAAGVTFTLGVGTEIHYADPICIMSDRVGMTETEIVLSNSSTAPASVTIIAAE